MMRQDDELNEIEARWWTLSGPDCFNGYHPLDRVVFATEEGPGRCRQCDTPIELKLISWLTSNA